MGKKIKVKDTSQGVIFIDEDTKKLSMASFRDLTDKEIADCYQDAINVITNPPKPFDGITEKE